MTTIDAGEWMACRRGEVLLLDEPFHSGGEADLYWGLWRPRVAEGADAGGAGRPTQVVVKVRPGLRSQVPPGIDKISHDYEREALRRLAPHGVSLFPALIDDLEVADDERRRYLLVLSELPGDPVARGNEVHPRITELARDPAFLAEAINRLADPLAAGHEQGVFHGDPSAGNYHFNPDAPLDAWQLLDFGAASFADRPRRVNLLTPAFADSTALRGAGRIPTEESDRHYFCKVVALLAGAPNGAPAEIDDARYGPLLGELLEQARHDHRPGAGWPQSVRHTAALASAAVLRNEETPGQALARVQAVAAAVPLDDCWRVLEAALQWAESCEDADARAVGIAIAARLAVHRDRHVWGRAAELLVRLADSDALAALESAAVDWGDGAAIATQVRAALSDVADSRRRGVLARRIERAVPEAGVLFDGPVRGGLGIKRRRPLLTGTWARQLVAESRTAEHPAGGVVAINDEHGQRVWFRVRDGRLVNAGEGVPAAADLVIPALASDWFDFFVKGDRRASVVGTRPSALFESFAEALPDASVVRRLTTKPPKPEPDPAPEAGPERVGADRLFSALFDPPQPAPVRRRLPHPVRRVQDAWAAVELRAEAAAKAVGRARRTAAAKRPVVLRGVTLAALALAVTSIPVAAARWLAGVPALSGLRAAAWIPQPLSMRAAAIVVPAAGVLLARTARQSKLVFGASALAAAAAFAEYLTAAAPWRHGSLAEPMVAAAALGVLACAATFTWPASSRHVVMLVLPTMAMALAPLGLRLVSMDAWRFPLGIGLAVIAAVGPAAAALRVPPHIAQRTLRVAAVVLLVVVLAAPAGILERASWMGLFGPPSAASDAVLGQDRNIVLGLGSPPDRRTAKAWGQLADAADGPVQIDVPRFHLRPTNLGLRATVELRARNTGKKAERLTTEGDSTVRLVVAGPRELRQDPLRNVGDEGAAPVQYGSASLRTYLVPVNPPDYPNPKTWDSSTFTGTVLERDGAVGGDAYEFDRLTFHLRFPGTGEGQRDAWRSPLRIIGLAVVRPDGSVAGFRAADRWGAHSHAGTMGVSRPDAAAAASLVDGADLRPGDCVRLPSGVDLAVPPASAPADGRYHVVSCTDRYDVAVITLGTPEPGECFDRLFDWVVTTPKGCGDDRLDYVLTDVPPLPKDAAFPETPEAREAMAKQLCRHEWRFGMAHKEPWDPSRWAFACVTLTTAAAERAERAEREHKT